MPPTPPLHPRALTRDEFTAAIAELKADLRDDLRAITDHLATLNGRTRKGEVVDAEMRVEIAHLKQQLEAPRDPAPRPLSGRAQAALVGGAVVVLTVAVKVLGLVTAAAGDKVLDLVLRR